MSGQPVTSLSNGSLDSPVLEARGVTKHYSARESLFRRTTVRAVEDVSVEVKEGSTLCVAGETGSGKTTLAKLLVGLLRPDRGEIRFRGRRVDQLDRSSQRQYRLGVQMVFQNPLLSFNPMLTIGATLRDALGHSPRVDATRPSSEVQSLLQSVGLDRRFAHRYPREVSGGELQRAGIARALATDPQVVILDEPASALDVSIRGQIFNLLADLQRDNRLAYVLVTHDLQTARLLANEVVVMYLGKVVEAGSEDSVLAQPRHPYTVALLSATLPAVAGEQAPERIILRGDLPSATAPPPGCRFHTRCWLYERLGRPEQCASLEPALAGTSGKQRAACHFADRVPFAHGLTTAPPGGGSA